MSDKGDKQQYIDNLLTGLQPKLHNNQRKLCLSNFSDYYFESLPIFNEKEVELLYLGYKKHTGLLNACGLLSWKRMNTLKEAAILALDVLVKLLDHQTNPNNYQLFLKIFKSIPHELSIQQMNLHLHLNNSKSHDNARVIEQIIGMDITTIIKLQQEHAYTDQKLQNQQLNYAIKGFGFSLPNISLAQKLTTISSKSVIGKNYLIAKCASVAAASRNKAIELNEGMMTNLKNFFNGNRINKNTLMKSNILKQAKYFGIELSLQPNVIPYFIQEIFYFND